MMPTFDDMSKNVVKKTPRMYTFYFTPCIGIVETLSVLDPVGTVQGIQCNSNSNVQKKCGVIKQNQSEVGTIQFLLFYLAVCIIFQLHYAEIPIEIDLSKDIAC